MDRFPLPGFETSWGWANLWGLSNTSSAQAQFTNEGFVRIEKLAAHTVHLILNGNSDDLKSLTPGAGVKFPVEVKDGILFGLVCEVSGSATAQLVVHAFSREGSRISREVVDNGFKSMFVANPLTDALLLTIRLSGLGSITIKRLDAREHAAARGVPPGTYPLGKAEMKNSASVSAVASDIGSVMSVRQALRDAVPMQSILTEKEALPLAVGLTSTDNLLEAKEIVRGFDLYRQLPLATLHKMLAHALDTGYLVHALACAEEIERRGTGLLDRRGAAEIAHELKFLRDPWQMMPEVGVADSRDPGGPILHLVGKAFPKKQNGYTIRTKSTTEAQSDAGLNPIVAVQSGGLSKLSHEQQLLLDNSSVAMVSLGDIGRSDLPTPDWLRENVCALSKLVRELRPRVIHAHSNFINVVLATHVGESLSVPVVYEVRGIWEESWRARTALTEHWLGAENGMRMFGSPEYFEWTQRAERAARERVAHIVTLSETLKDFIVGDPSSGIQAEDVTVIPNAASPHIFSLEYLSQKVRVSLGVPRDAIVFGYISTLSAHEDIETLIEAYEAFARERSTIDHRLLIVGAGPKLNELKRLVRERQLGGVLFPGRIDNQDVDGFYAAIDVFVTPRSTSRVSQLVTPLKPFEAMASGCISVLADIPALREVGGYGAETTVYFPPGDSRALAEIFDAFALQPELFTSDERRSRIRNSCIPTWESNAQKYAAVYEKVSKNKK